MNGNKKWKTMFLVKNIFFIDHSVRGVSKCELLSRCFALHCIFITAIDNVEKLKSTTSNTERTFFKISVNKHHLICTQHYRNLCWLVKHCRGWANSAGWSIFISRFSRRFSILDVPHWLVLVCAVWLYTKHSVVVCLLMVWRLTNWVIGGKNIQDCVPGLKF